MRRGNLSTKRVGMNDLTTQAVLRHNSMFRGVSDATLDGLCNIAHRRTYKKGALIFSKGDAGDALYCVASGRIRIFASDPAGSELILNNLGPGDTFGEIAVIDGRSRTASALAAQDSTLVAIPTKRFQSYIARDPDLALHLLGLMCERLRWVSELVEDSMFLSGPIRLAKRLEILAEVNGRSTDGAPIEVEVSQTELSQFLGVSRQTINKYLNDWENNGWVCLHRGYLEICDVEALKTFVDTSTP